MRNNKIAIIVLGFLGLTAAIAIIVAVSTRTIEEVKKDAISTFEAQNTKTGIHIKDLDLTAIDNDSYKGTMTTAESDGEFTYDVSVKYTDDKIQISPVLTQDSVKAKIKAGVERDSGLKVTGIDLVKTNDQTYTGTISQQEADGEDSYNLTVTAPPGASSIAWSTSFTKETLTKKVRSDIQQHYNDQGLTVTDLSLVKINDHEYSGLLETSQTGGVFKDNIHVIADDNTFKWEIKD